MGESDISGAKLAADVDETLLNVCKVKPEQSGTRRHDQIKSGGNERLVLAINLAQAAFGGGTRDGVADGNTGGNHAHASGSRGGGFRTRTPEQKKRATIGAATVLACRNEIAVALHALRGAEALRRRRSVSAGHGGSGRIRRPSGAYGPCGGG